MESTAVVLNDPLSSDMLDFEKRIAYFFGVKNPERVACHYIQAVKKIEQLGKHALEKVLREQVMPDLLLAYQEIGEQKQLQFPVEKAAELEFQLFLNSSFEEDYLILVQIYETVFQTQSHHFLKAAMLRSFLYKYKNSIFEKTGQLTQSDQEILLRLAKESEDEMLLLEQA